MTTKWKLTDDDFPDVVDTLDPIEIRIVQGLADDHSYDEIANQVSMTRHAVQARLWRVRVRLDCVTTAGVLALLLRRGLIH